MLENQEDEGSCLENLHVDCFKEILKYLEIEEKKRLRLCCSVLSQRVEELDANILILTARQ